MQGRIFSEFVKLSDIPKHLPNKKTSCNPQNNICDTGEHARAILSPVSFFSLSYFCMLAIKTSVQRMNKYGDKGSPCRRLH